MTTDRRSFLIGAVTAAVIGPSVVASASIVPVKSVSDHTRAVMDIFRKNYDNLHVPGWVEPPHSVPSDFIDLDITKRMVEQYPEMFPINNIMHGPCHLFDNVPIAAISRAYKTEFTLEEIQDRKAVIWVGDMIEELNNELPALLMRELREYAGGRTFYPYQPVIMVRAVDYETYMPKIAFKFRGGFGA